jgi:phage FluMu gp28-like protein
MSAAGIQVPKHTGTDLPEAMAGLDKSALLLPFQARANMLIHQTRLLVIEKSRRIGLSWGVAAEAVLTAAAQRSAGGMKVFYTCYNQDITREFIEYCAMWSKAFSYGLGEIVEEDIFDEEDKRPIKTFRIDYASGFSIVALVSSPRALRGRQGLVIIDEAAYVTDLTQTLKAGLALLIRGGRLVVISTHNGVDNPFNQLIDEINTGRRAGKTMKITFMDAIADGLYERIALMDQNDGLGKEEWIAGIYAFYGDLADEELDCVPAAGAGCFIPPELVVAAQHEDAAKPDLYLNGICVGGRDVARRRDLSVMWVFEIVKNVLWLRERREERGITFRAQDEIFDGQFNRFRILRYGVDQTGMGEKVVEDAVGRHGERVQGVLFTGPNKLDMATAMKKRFEDGTIRIPDDAVIRSDFRAIKKAKGIGDTVRLVNDNDEVHADLFWACALACLMADTDAPACTGYRSAPRDRGRFDEAPSDRSGWNGGAPGRMRMRPDEPNTYQGGFRRQGTW